MPANIIRPATPNDAQQWVTLATAVLGANHPVKEVYDPAWAACQLDPKSGHETWVAESDGKLLAALSFLKASDEDHNPVANIGRNLHLPESFPDGATELLLRKVAEIATERQQMLVARIPESDLRHQSAYEAAGFICAGFQPFKHMLSARVGTLFYVRPASPILMTRLPLSESLPQIAELATAVLERLKISNPLTVRDGATGYPLQSDLQVHESTQADFELWKMQAQPSNPPVEVSGAFNLGCGIMRVATDRPIRAILGQRDEQIVGGLAFYFDEPDRCVRLVDSFATDDLTTGALLQHALQLAQQQFNAVYAEVDVLATAPRLLKSAEQLGFVPVAYLPAFYFSNGNYADVVKLVKLNMAYSLERRDFTVHARAIVEIVDQNFQDQKVGVAIINLLRGLPIFEGLGDGELQKIARLFTQKLYRPGEAIFNKGDSGDAAYIVMRGQIDIKLEEKSPPVASVPSGKIFGELAFLDGSSRNAYAMARQASILLIVQRSALNALAQREPHLGMLIMRNIAMDLSNKLRNANLALSARR